MKKLPEPVKWLILALAFAGIFAVLWYVNLRSGQVEMPPPESWIRAAASLG